jgi:hypothetical protein
MAEGLLVRYVEKRFDADYNATLGERACHRLAG